MTALETQCEKTIESMKALFDFLLRRNAELEALLVSKDKQIGELEDQIFDLERIVSGQREEAAE